MRTRETARRGGAPRARGSAPRRKRQTEQRRPWRKTGWERRVGIGGWRPAKPSRPIASRRKGPPLRAQPTTTLARAPPQAEPRLPGTLRRTAAALAAVAPRCAAMQLHRARFVEWTPAAVAALAATADGSAVAVGRDDGAIELYDVASDWRCAARIPGCAGASITALLWTERAAARGGGGAASASASPRLFSAGLSGEIVEWDTQALRPLAATDSTGGPVWHMSARAPDDSGAPQVRRRLHHGRTSVLRD